MTELKQVYKCELCGNIVEVLHTGKGELVCCGQAMKLMTEQTADQSKEKHVPVLTREENGYKVVVGSTPHPMVEDHYIEWIEIITTDGVFRKYLKAGNPPETEFSNLQPQTGSADNSGEILKVREYCNKHGLWAN